MDNIIDYSLSYMPPSGASSRVGEFSRLGDDYGFARITSAAALTDFMSRSFRISGFTIILCKSGVMEIEINASPYTVSGGMLIVVSPGSILTVKDVDGSNLDMCVLLVSTAFLNDLTFDLNVINSVGFNPERKPVLTLTDHEVALMQGYFNLIHTNTLTNPDAMFVRGISGNLLSAAMYQMVQFYYSRPSEREPETAGQRPLSRRNNYVKEFLQLVHLHYRRERATAFYASKLFISAKYLSHIIKESTGRSAAEWIDYHVILEAKNLLRYSGRNVQQVAYELNFPNQSAFGKYFKHITGMSPTEFQRKC